MFTSEKEYETQVESIEEIYKVNDDVQAKRFFLSESRQLAKVENKKQELIAYQKELKWTLRNLKKEFMVSSTNTRLIGEDAKFFKTVSFGIFYIFSIKGRPNISGPILTNFSIYSKFLGKNFRQYCPPLYILSIYVHNFR